jgi:Flp pilus assembly pilin Flp
MREFTYAKIKTTTPQFFDNTRQKPPRPALTIPALARALLADQRGTTILEYGFIATLVLLGGMYAYSNLGVSVLALYDHFAAQMQAATS